MAGRPAILRGTAVRSGKEWPIWPYSDENERELIDQVFAGGTWGAYGGSQSHLLADEFANFQGARHGLAMNDGSHTLEAALAACGVGEGDEVLVPGMTFYTTAAAVLAVNATPVLVDIDPFSLCIDPEAASAAVTERTKAIVPVHLAGTACDLEALMGLCAKHGLAMVEDCAHAHGTRWQGRGVGSFGDFGSFSFQEAKLMTAGEGGALLTNDEELRERAWSYANCGRVEGGDWFHHVGYGTNLRMTEWQAAILRAQLARLPRQHRVRSERAELLDRELARFPGLTPQAGDPRMDSRARTAYVFRFDPTAFDGLTPHGFELALRHEGILLGRAYPSLNTLEVFRQGAFGPRMRASAPKVDYSSQRLPRAEAASTETIWLSHRVLLAEPEDVLDVVEAIDRISQNAGKIRLRTGMMARVGGEAVRGVRRRLSRSS
jgi:dTDP-4-amino-4,6-dideoxygalactose transaminase